jgi:hypothetical protein
MTSKKYWRKKLLNYLIRDCFGTINESDVIEVKEVKTDKGKGYIVKLGGEVIHKQMLGLLSEQARQFDKTELWKFMTTTLRKKGMELTTSMATDYEQVWGGKLLQYIVKFQEDLLNDLKKL